MEDSCSSSRGILASIENVDVNKVRPKRPIEDVCGYEWHNPRLELDERRKVAEQRRDELLHHLYQEGLPTAEAEALVREWLVLLTERDRLLREHLNQENGCDKSSYVRELKHLLRAHPSFAESEEVGLREALLTLRTQVTTYCTRHNITSPIAGSKVASIEADVEANVEAPSPLETGDTPIQKPVDLDHQTGQSRITTRRSRHSTEGAAYCPLEHPRPTTPHPPLPAKPKNLGDKLTHLSPRKELIASPDKSRQAPSIKTRPVDVVALDDDLIDGGGSPEKIPSKTVTKDVFDLRKTTIRTNEKHATTDTGSHTITDTGSHSTPPLPPPIPPQLTVTRHTATGTGQFVGPQQATLTDGKSLNNEVSPIEGKPLDNDPTNEAQDPSLELPASEERSLLLNEISSLGQTILRRTNHNRSPGGTPIRANKNRLTLTGNTDMLQRALISKFRSFHSTPINNKGDKIDSMEVSNAWSDLNGSVVYDDPDITATSNSPIGFSDCSRLDPNLSSAV